MTSRLGILLAAAVAAAGCAPRLLPGTNIRESPDTQAIYERLEQYRQAMERRDPDAVLAMVAPDYFDTAGTPEAGDDVDLEELERRLPADLQGIEGLRIDLTVRDIQVTGDRATAEVFYEAFYRVRTPSGLVPRRDADVHQMRLRKIDGEWKFTGGL